jgi:hypothetical protein
MLFWPMFVLRSAALPFYGFAYKHAAPGPGRTRVIAGTVLFATVSLICKLLPHGGAPADSLQEQLAELANETYNVRHFFAFHGGITVALYLTASGVPGFWFSVPEKTAKSN